MNTIAINQAPLADRVRPSGLEGFFGQEELVGEKSFLRQAIATDTTPSMVLWGPPGSGKTTLAYIISKQTNADFIQISAVSSGLKDLREILVRAEANRQTGKKTILFIDEIHRWNKAQQDALLPYVEKGIIILIGATTENPSFEVNSALISRTRVLVLHKLDEKAIRKILDNALQDKTNGLGNANIEISDESLDLISHVANGDARMALNTLEVCVGQNQPITSEVIKQVLQKMHLQYDKTGEEHYNIISALHKSLRGGDAHASLYWLARMLEAGEDPLYVARRLVRFASEDVGLADNFAVVLANNVFEVCQKIGMPECSVHLTQLVIYLARAKKNIVAYQAYSLAKDDVEKYGNLPVPLHLRNAPTKLMKELKYGEGYKYTPIEDSSIQTYLPEELKSREYFHE
ncbi:MAG: replication-associated recombination protein A [Patescibacteria group bacterium]